MKDLLGKKRVEQDDKNKETSFFKDEIEKEVKDTSNNKWKNRVKVLMVASRGISNQERVLMNNIMSLVPHSKKECKIERKIAQDQLNEICYNNSCNTGVYFEHKKREFCMWIFKSPEGPSFKFQVNSITTLDEPKMIGNCLKYSRPILSFDKSFDDDKTPHLGLMKEVLTSVFNTPKLHPKSKPFHDHIETFNNINDTIYFRNYQILNDLKETFKSTDDVDKLQLVEIGPRCALKLIKVFDGVLGGKCLYTNPSYIAPSLVLKKNHMKFKDRQEKLLLKENEVQEKFNNKEDLNTRWILNKNK